MLKCIYLKFYFINVSKKNPIDVSQEKDDIFGHALHVNENKKKKSAPSAGGFTQCIIRNFFFLSNDITFIVQFQIQSEQNQKRHVFFEYFHSFAAKDMLFPYTFSAPRWNTCFFGHFHRFAVKYMFFSDNFTASWWNIRFFWTPLRGEKSSGFPDCIKKTLIFICSINPLRGIFST